ncbi:nicotinate phosphoribosyltransferase [Amylostereum chailletii]|nr:nicotinate phosphoribosyltransferase [Amylostereum chailletii]
MTSATATSVIPKSILDTDLYKLTMQQAVLRCFPDVQSTYRFTHRDKDVYFTRACYERFKEAVSMFSELALTAPERDWLEKTCPYFTASYLDYLSSYRFKPEQVHIDFVSRAPEDSDEGRIEIEIAGPWVEAIFWEVPLMATLSEIYFTTVDTDWDEEGQAESAFGKGKALLEAGCVVSEFGTRRRRSYHVQDLVVRQLLLAARECPGKGRVFGTSNVHLAHKHGTTPVGTIAHEWFMGVAAIRGYERANSVALNLWEEVYPGVLLLALTDTFSTKAFFQDFSEDPERARRWRGLRQDSGDPFTFAPLAQKVYSDMGIDHREKTIIYSDSLDVDKALALQKQCSEIGFMPSFGIGTFFTNDYRKASSGGKDKSKALNMVIKLASVNQIPCVKISDDLNKNTGHEGTVRQVKDMYKLHH